MYRFVIFGAQQNPMKKLQTLLVSLVIILITACGGKNLTAEDGVYFQDFDNLRCWARDQWNITGEMAHSGDFSARTDSSTEFSQTFQMEFSYAKAKGYKSVEVTGWIYLYNMNAKASLVCSVENASGNLAYESADVKNFITAPNQWEKISVLLKLPENAPHGSDLKVYLWSPNKSKIFLDDVTIKFSR